MAFHKSSVKEKNTANLVPLDEGAVPLTFAPNGQGILCHVDDVSNGLACDCVCPSCGSRLVAKQGSAIAHHFAHEGDADCTGAVETALHLAAKEILLKTRRMTLPPVSDQAHVVDSSGCRHTAKSSIPAKSIVFDAVSAEVQLGGLVPDIVATVAGKTLLVEIAVSHFADPRKVTLLAERGLATVEIDLSGMADGWTWGSLADSVVEEVSRKKWLFNPKSKSLHLEALRLAEGMAEKAGIEKAEQAKRIRKSHELQQSSIPGFLVAKQHLDEFLSPSSIAAERARMEVEGPMTGAWQSASRLLGVKWDKPPEHINVEVPGELGSPVDRRVWQAALFALFVRQNRNKTFTAKSAAKWCVQTFGWRPEFAVIQKHDHLLTPEEQVSLPSASRAVYAYLRVLEGCGFIVRKGERYEILRRRI